MGVVDIEILLNREKSPTAIEWEQHQAKKNTHSFSNWVLYTAILKRNGNGNGKFSFPD